MLNTNKKRKLCGQSEDSKKKLIIEQIYREIKVKFENTFMNRYELNTFLGSIRDNIEDYIKYFPKDIIIQNDKDFINNINVCLKPKSGDFFIVNTDTCKNWKFDGHEYFKN